jgi:hypothetical protein
MLVALLSDGFRRLMAALYLDPTDNNSDGASSADREHLRHSAG